MAWQDEVAQKRQEAVAAQASKSLHNESITAVRDSGKGVEGATHGLAKSQDIDSLIAQVKELQLASLLGASKPSVVLTDQTDLGDKIGELTDRLDATVKTLDSSEMDAKQLSELKSLSVALIQLKSSLNSDNSDVKKALNGLTKAVNSMTMSPVVNVPAPNVTVQSSKVDLSPLQDTLKEYFTSPDTDKVDLDDYRAQDIKDSGDFQYVGFVSPEGGWYIIENDTKNNSLRYVFGSTGYAKAFKKATSYQYMLLNEAVNALST